jgi:hypothetical protein
VTKTALIVSFFALASGAYASTISTFNISTTAGLQAGDPCSMSGAGPASASCSSSSHDQFGSSAEANITLTDNSLESSVTAPHSHRLPMTISILCP